MNIKHKIKDWLTRPELLSSEVCIIEPGTSVDIDSYLDRPGSYTAYIDLRDLTNIDSLSIQIYIKPKHNEGEILYLSASPKSSEESLWMTRIPPCAGFKIKYVLGHGKELKLITSIWS